MRIKKFSVSIKIRQRTENDYHSLLKFTTSWFRLNKSLNCHNVKICKKHQFGQKSSFAIFVPVQSIRRWWSSPRRRRRCCRLTGLTACPARPNRFQIQSFLLVRLSDPEISTRSFWKVSVICWPMELFCRRRWTNGLAQKSNKCGMCCIIFMGFS